MPSRWSENGEVHDKDDEYEDEPPSRKSQQLVELNNKRKELNFKGSICIICMNAPGTILAELPDTPENRELAFACSGKQSKFLKVCAHEGTTQAIVCALCKAMLKLPDDDNDAGAQDDTDAGLEESQIKQALLESMTDAQSDQDAQFDHLRYDTEEAEIKAAIRLSLVNSSDGDPHPADLAVAQDDKDAGHEESQIKQALVESMTDAQSDGDMLQRAIVASNNAPLGYPRFEAEEEELKAAIRLSLVNSSDGDPPSC